MFDLELRDHLDPKEPGTHRIVCALNSGVVEVPSFVSIKVGKKKCVARIVGIERSGRSLERFEEVSREAVVTVVVLDAAENAAIARIARPLRKQPLKPAKPAEAALAERTFEAERLSLVASNVALQRIHAVESASAQQRLERLGVGPLSTSAMSSCLSFFESGEALEKVLAFAVGGQISKTIAGAFEVTIGFRSGDASFTLHCEAPGSTPDARWPASFTRLLHHHARVSFFAGANVGDNDWLGITLSEEGLPGELTYRDVAVEDTLCPLWSSSDCYVYHPTERNLAGEPSIVFVSHEGAVRPPEPEPIGPLFVRLMLETLT